jgi:DNA-binding response OmpR family regulator
LLVEDDEALRQLALQVLQMSGYQVLVASNGQEALQIADKQGKGVDLVLTDVIMPILNGPQMVAQLHRLFPRVKVVYMSGYTDSHLSDLDLHESGATLLHKPFHPHTLIETIRKVLGSPVAG